MVCTTINAREELVNNLEAPSAYLLALSIPECHSLSLPLSLPSSSLLLTHRILFQTVSSRGSLAATTIVIFHGSKRAYSRFGISGLRAPRSGTTSTGIESTARPSVWASRCRRKTATPFIQNVREVCSTCSPRWSREIYSGGGHVSFRWKPSSNDFSWKKTILSDLCAIEIDVANDRCCGQKFF